MTKFNRSKLRGRIVEKFGTQGEFAKAIGGVQATISQLLNSENNPNSETIYKWAQALDIGTEEIGEYFFTPEIKEIF